MEERFGPGLPSQLTTGGSQTSVSEHSMGQPSNAGTSQHTANPDFAWFDNNPRVANRRVDLPFAIAEPSEIELAPQGVENTAISIENLKHLCRNETIVIVSWFSLPFDGVDFFAGRFGVSVDCFDLEISADHDLADDAYWRSIMDNVDQGMYAGGGGGAPCSSFSASRNTRDGGPRPLRGEWEPEIFGLPHLTPDEKAIVRLGTLLALRNAEAFGKFHEANKPFWAETLAQRPGCSSVFKLPQWLQIQNFVDVMLDTFPQCELGGEWLKWTDVMQCWLHIAFPKKYTHTPCWWRQPWNGKWYFGAHPPLRGAKEWSLHTCGSVRC